MLKNASAFYLLVVCFVLYYHNKDKLYFRMLFRVI